MEGIFNKLLINARDKRKAMLEKKLNKTIFKEYLNKPQIAPVIDNSELNSELCKRIFEIIKNTDNDKIFKISS
jgi:hypothetical protein